LLVGPDCAKRHRLSECSTKPLDAFVASNEENLWFRWFLFLGLEDEVFDPSTITVSLRRVGPCGCRSLLARLNHQLSLAGLLSDCAFADSTLVPAAAAIPLPADEVMAAADREADPLLELLREAPVRVRILTADTGYR